MELFDILTAGTLSALLLEGIKVIIRKFKPEFDFSETFYLVLLPVLNVLMPFPMVWLGLEVTAPTLGMGWLDLVKYLVLTVLSSLASVFVYTSSVKPLKIKAQERKLLKG